jgi:hypothetical protein
VIGQEGVITVLVFALTDVEAAGTFSATPMQMPGANLVIGSECGSFIKGEKTFNGSAP